MADRLLPGTTPAAPDDRGAADPHLAAALASGDARALWPALLAARLLVPIVALPSAGADAEMAVPHLVAADGARALPVFSSYEQLAAWRPDVRPVPMTGTRVVLGAVGEGYDGIVLDVAGARPFTVAGAALRELAAAVEGAAPASETIAAVTERDPT